MEFLAVVANVIYVVALAALYYLAASGDEEPRSTFGKFHFATSR